MGKIKRFLIQGTFFFHINNRITKTFKGIRKGIDNGIALAIRKAIYSKGEIQNNKVFVMTFENSYTCNPKYIVEELLKRDMVRTPEEAGSGLYQHLARQHGNQASVRQLYVEEESSQVQQAH